MLSPNLSPKISQVLITLADHLVPIPEELGVIDRKNEIIEGTGRFIRELPLFMRIGLLWALRLFEWLPFFFGFGFKAFTHLSSEMQGKYIKTWAYSKIAHKREIFKAIRDLICVVALSDKRLWPYFGYAPEEHLKEKIQLREKLMNEAGANINS